MVLLALRRWALDQRVELPLAHDLVCLKPADVAHVGRHLNAGLDIADTGHNAADVEQMPDFLSFDFSQLRDVLFGVGPWD